MAVRARRDLEIIEVPFKSPTLAPAATENLGIAPWGPGWIDGARSER
jgi:hypothetical protein